MRFFRALVRALIDDDIPDVGAMLAYYAVLALFPMLVFVGSVALLVLPADTLTQGAMMATEAAPPGVRAIVIARIDALVAANHAGFAVGAAALALWGASRGAAGLGNALGAIYSKVETRSWLRRQITAIVVTLVVAVIVVIALALLVAGPAVGHYLGLGGAFDTAWNVGRWVGAGLLVMFVWAIVYKFLPDTDAPFRVFTPGAFLGVLVWLGISALFGLYLSHVGSYEATYGALGTAIVFLVWLWMSNIALLFGAEVNDVLADTRAHRSDAAARLADPHEHVHVT